MKRYIKASKTYKATLKDGGHIELSEEGDYFILMEYDKDGNPHNTTHRYSKVEWNGSTAWEDVVDGYGSEIVD
jgi:hypothetical protein